MLYSDFYLSSFLAFILPVAWCLFVFLPVQQYFKNFSAVKSQLISVSIKVRFSKKKKKDKKSYCVTYSIDLNPPLYIVFSIVFGMAQLGIEPTTALSQEGSSIRPLSWS